MNAHTIDTNATPEPQQENVLQEPTLKTLWETPALAIIPIEETNSGVGSNIDDGATAS